MSSECVPRSPKAPDAGHLRVGHPPPRLGDVARLLVEPAAERARVAVPRRGVRDLPEGALRDLVAKEEVLGVRAHEVARGEEEPGLLDGVGHLAALGSVHAERLLDEEVLLRGSAGRHQLAVAVRLREDHDALHLGVAKDLGRRRRRLRADDPAPLRDARRVGIPRPLHAHVLPLGEQLREAGHVDVRAADEAEGQRRSALRRGGTPGGRAGGQSRRGEGGRLQERAAIGVFHVRVLR